MWIPLVGVATAVGLWLLLRRDDKPKEASNVPPEGRPPSPVQASDVRMGEAGPYLDPSKTNEAYNFAASKFNEGDSQGIGWIIVFQKKPSVGLPYTPILVLPQERTSALMQGKLLSASMKGYGYAGYMVSVQECTFTKEQFIRFAMGDLGVVYENTCYPIWQETF